jgi:AcrR family transcriptional regulator
VNNIRQNIILATIECIEKKGIHLVTVRDIAAQAKVNIAAVNYYFGSKTKLLQEALKFTLYNTLAENIEEFKQQHPDPRAFTRAFFNDLLQGAMKFPNLTKAHIYEPFAEGNYKVPFVGWVNDFASSLSEQLEKVYGPVANSRKIKIAVSQMISVVFFCALLPDMFKKFLGMDFRDPAKREEYLDELMRRYLPGDGEGEG